MVVPLITELALLEAELHQPEAALRIDNYLTELGTRGGPVTLGTLHEARAQVALLGGDEQGAREHLAQVKRWFLSTANPALVARYERLQREIASGNLELNAPPIDDAGTSSVEAVRAALYNCVTAKDRAAGALDLLLNETGAPTGFLFSYEESELALLCKRGNSEPPSDLVERLRHEIENATMASGSTTRAASPAPCTARPADYQVFVLSDRKRVGGRTIVAAAIAEGGGSLRAPAPAFLGAVAAGLDELITASPS